jgi:crossover junction endodeoxyribonuclease RuvC
MFDEVILGVDPGTASIGLAAVARGTGRPEVRAAMTVRTAAGGDKGDRLQAIWTAVSEAIATHGATAVAVERLLWNRNVGSAMEVARASGVAMLAAAQAGLPVSEYAPLEVKMAVTGVGNASKDQVRRALELLLGSSAVPTQPDAADAVAVAVCHLQQVRLRRLVGEPVR